MPTRSLAVVLLTCCVARADVPAATTAPATPDERAAVVQELAPLPKRPATRAADFFDVGVEDDFLFVRPGLPLNGSVTTAFVDWPGYFRADELPSAGAWSFKHTTIGRDNAIASITQLGVTASSLLLSRDSETPTRTSSVQLIQHREVGNVAPVQLLVTGDVTDGASAAGAGVAQASPALRLTALTFTDLCREHPAEVRQYLLPVLRDLGAAGVLRTADAAKAWQVLGGDVPPDPKTVARIDTLVRRLDGDDFADRAKAEDELAALGPAGAAALRRRDTATWSPDVRAAVESARRRSEPLSPEQAEAFRADVPFLIETLRMDDPALAAPAAKRLAAITGQTVDLPAGLSSAERAKRIDAYAAAVTPKGPAALRDEGP